MSFAKRPLSLATAAGVALELGLAGSGSNGAPTAARPAAKATSTTAKPATAPAPATATTPAATTPAKTATKATPVTTTGQVTIMLSSLKADNVAGLAVQLSGPGLEEPIGKKLTAEELKTSNTLAFENIPTGNIKAEIAAFDKDDETLGESTSDVVVKTDEESKVAIQLTAPTPTSAEGPAKVAFKFVAPEAFQAYPASEPADGESPSTTPSTTPSTSPSPSAPAADGKALKVEIADMQVLRKYLIFKRLEVTLTVTNESTTKTLDGEVKCEFHKLKGIFTKEDAIVETLTAPVSHLAPGKSVTITLTSSVSAEDAEATVHTVVSTSTASTYE